MRHTTESLFHTAAVAPPPLLVIVDAHTGVDRRQIDAAIQFGAKGVVIDGHLSRSALAAAADAVKQGIAVVRSSRTGGGVVERNIEVDDDRPGFVVADELNPQTSRVLLMLALTRTRDQRELQEILFSY